MGFTRSSTQKTLDVYLTFCYCAAPLSINNSQAKCLVYECQTSGVHAKRANQETNKKDNAAACLRFLNYLAFLRPAADRAASILPWVVSRGRS
jgi:hypothetical protein